MPRTFNGVINLPTNFDISITRPLDSRLVVDTFSDLTNGSIEYPYQGMVVYVKETESLYTLKTKGIGQSYDSKNWQLVNNKGIEVVDKLDNLTDGTIEKPYIGMMVYVIEKENVYISKTNDVELSHDIKNWKLMTGSGTTTPPTLLNFWYRGCVDDRFEIDDNLSSKIISLSSSKSISGSVNMNKVYGYIAIDSDQNITSIITDNNENITSQFSYIVSVNIDGNEYRLYEFFLDTLISLDVNITIKITGSTE